MRWQVAGPMASALRERRTGPLARGGRREATKGPC
jgi:hypothetical protein